MSKVTSFTYDPIEKAVNIGTDDGDDITLDCSEIPELIDKLRDVFRHYQNGVMLEKIKELAKQYEPH